MKKLILFILILSFFNSFAQSNDLANEVVIDIIEHRPIRNGEIRIVPKIYSYEDFFYKKTGSK